MAANNPDAIAPGCVDSRGISRGKCTSAECDCDKYDGGSDKKKCLCCGHPPGKHNNLDSIDSGEKQAECMSGDCKKYVASSFIKNRMVPFEYCSPECRDKNLLNIHRQQLEVHIEDMESTLKKKSPIFIPLRHPSEKSRQEPQVSTERGHGLMAAQEKSNPPAPDCFQKNERANSPTSRRGASKVTEKSRQEPQVSTERGHGLMAAQEKSNPPTPDCFQKNERANSPTSRRGASKEGKKKGKGRGQNNRYKEVLLKKDANNDCGIIVYDRFWQQYDNDRNVIGGLLVTGVKIKSTALKLLQDCKIQFCDVIVKVDDTPVTEEMCAAQQNILYNILSRFDCSSVKLTLYREGYYHPDDSAKAISQLLKSAENASHIINVIHPKNLYMAADSESGMSIINTEVLNITETSPSYSCGMRNEDKFLGSVNPRLLNNRLVTRHDGKKLICDTISKAIAGNDIIIAIRRK